MSWWDRTDDSEPQRGERARAPRRSVYEDRDLTGDEPEAAWRRIGELDPRSGARVDGPHWHQPQRPSWMGR